MKAGCSRIDVKRGNELQSVLQFRQHVTSTGMIEIHSAMGPMYSFEADDAYICTGEGVPSQVRND